MQAPTGAIGRFTDQAYNAILLAEDEARMLGQPVVEPVHLLLAAARRGNVEQLLAREGIVASAIHAAVVRMGGFGAQLVLGPVPRSTGGEAVLAQALTAAAERGIDGPSTQHLLLGLAGHSDAMAVLGELGLVDLTTLVDATYPVRRPALDPYVLQRRAHAAPAREPPSPGPIPPVFERFSAQAHLALEAAQESARSLENQYVGPAHLLLGLLDVKDGVLANVLSRHQTQRDAMARRAAELLAGHARAARQKAEEVVDRRARVSTAPTGIFSVHARRLVAQEVLKVADRLGHRSLHTGHLFLAVLENPDQDTVAILEGLPDARQLAGEVIEALPGEEHT
ncbi:MAG TPA: Clp protease N-terminal domain-containing protein [Solirubrobacteraceae bacterium]